MLSNERDMLWIWMLWPGLGDPPLVRSEEVAFCPVSMSTSFDPASGTYLAVVRVSDVVFAAYDGGNGVDNVKVLDVSVLMLLREAAWMEEGENKDVSFWEERLAMGLLPTLRLFLVSGPFCQHSEAIEARASSAVLRVHSVSNGGQGTQDGVSLPVAGPS